MTFDEIVKKCADNKTLGEYLNSFLRKKGEGNAVEGSRISTHAAKYTDTYIPHIAYYDNEKIKSDYLCTSTLDTDIFDVSYSDSAFSGVAKFITSEMEDGRTVYEHLKLRTPEITEGFKKHNVNIDNYINSITVKEAGTPKESHQLLRQVYFPVDDEYNLLSVLPAMVLMSETNQRMRSLIRGKKIKKSHCHQMNAVTSNTANQTSRLSSQMASQTFISSLPPKSIRSDIKNKRRKEAIYPDIEMINALPGVEAGMLVNPDQGLDEIIKAGMPLNAKKVFNYDRAEKTKRDFLAYYGYESIPAGYEIHHIIPLSVGGADNIRNMILLFVDDHDKVTRTHSEYYGWKHRT